MQKEIRKNAMTKHELVYIETNEENNVLHFISEYVSTNYLF
jgi:hypothetical protein